MFEGALYVLKKKEKEGDCCSMITVNVRYVCCNQDSTKYYLINLKWVLQILNVRAYHK